jgi:hypothetical protein
LLFGGPNLATGVPRGGKVPEARRDLQSPYSRRVAEEQQATGSDLEPRYRSAIESGARLAGALAGGAVGLIGGPGGALGGAAVGWAAGETLPRVCREVISRVGERAATRTAAAVLLIEADTRQRSVHGERPRDDGFFETPDGERRSDAEELLEAVLRQAADAYEEQKLPYLSRIFTAVAHDPGVPTADAQYLAGLAGRLTYRQLVALSVFSHHGEHEDALISATVNQTEGTVSQDPGLRLELVDLIDEQILGVGDDYRVAAVGDPLVGLLPRERIGFGQLRLLPAGENLVQLMGLGDIDESERRDWLRQLGAALDE